ncbi:MAG: hypothetical protein ACLSBH_14425 [Coprobacillus cateniformis]
MFCFYHTFSKPLSSLISIYSYDATGCFASMVGQMHRSNISIYYFNGGVNDYKEIN